MYLRQRLRTLSKLVKSQKIKKNVVTFTSSSYDLISLHRINMCGNHWSR